MTTKKNYEDEFAAYTQETLIKFNGKLLMYRCAVMPMLPPKVSPGGIILSDMTQGYDRHLNRIGVMLAAGPCCYNHARAKSMGLKPEDFPKRGQWVLYGQYAPMKLTQQGKEVVLLNDDEILAIIDNPQDFEAHAYAGNS